MIRNISVGIDIGSSTIKVVVGEFYKGKKEPVIIGAGESISEGIRHGYINSIKDATSSLKKAIAQAEKTSRIKIKKAFISIGGKSLKGEFASGSAVISKADNEVTNLDIEKALEEAENNLNLKNKKVINTFPIFYKLDGKEISGRVEGNIGNRLEIKALFVTYSSQHLEDLITVIKQTGIDIIDIIACPIASEKLLLTKKQKILGSLLIDIGSETTSISIYENEVLVYLHTFKVGTSNIISDIALGLKISIEEAEKITFGEIPDGFSEKKIKEIIDARLTDIFELINKHLKKIKRNELLPGGIVWTGGGANIKNIANLSKDVLKLPAKIGEVESFGNIKSKIKNNTWYCCIGLLFIGKGRFYEEGSIKSFFKDLKNIVKNNLKQFKP